MWPLKAKSLLEGLGHGVLSFPENLLSEDCSIEVEGISTDSRKIGKKDVFLAICGEIHDGHDFVESALNNSASFAIVNFDWDGFQNMSKIHQSQCIRVSNTLRVFRCFASWFRNRIDFPIIAIGGSNGKTTTKEMIFFLLGGEAQGITKTIGSQNGFLGIALTLCQAAHNNTISAKTGSRSLILEIGIDEPSAMAYHMSVVRPDIVVLTSLGPEHLEKLGTLESAINEELNLFRCAPFHAKRIWNFSEPALDNYLEHFRCETDIMTVIDTKMPEKFDRICAKEFFSKVIPASLFFELSIAPHSNTIVAQNSGQRKFSNVPKLESDQINVSKQMSFQIDIPGIHNAVNLSVAIATALQVNGSLQSLQDNWSKFVPPPMRSNVLSLSKNVEIIEDYYNSSPLSLQAALDLMNASPRNVREKILILGDMLELGTESKKWHLLAAEQMLTLSNSALYLYGDSMYDVYKFLLPKSSIFRSLEYLPFSRSPADFFGKLEKQLSECSLLIKGSRGMQLERIASVIKESLAFNSE